MKFKKLAKVIDYNYVRINVRKGNHWEVAYDTSTGLYESIIKQYGEYKVNSIDLSLIDAFNHAVLGVYLKSNEDED